MKTHHTIIIAGAGGIAEAVGLLLMEWSEVHPTLFIGDRIPEKAKKVAEWITQGTTKSCAVQDFYLPEEGITDEMKVLFDEGDIILDCLPGSQAPRIAQFAKDFHLHYANLTEYVAETEAIMTLAKDAKTGFALQTGLAPGYIDLLAHGLFQEFCRDFGVDKVEKLELKVGALTNHAVAPHYYGFTWSPVGVATEYLKDTIVLRDYKKTVLPSLSERASIIIDGINYEDDLTSGGAADLPDALSGKVRSLDYKTLRHPGHYAWVAQQLTGSDKSDTAIKILQEKMEATIPHIEDDQIVLYAAVEGKDSNGVLRRREIAKRILPQQVGNHQLRAIQTTTAAPLAQTAQMLLEGTHSGIILQSQIDPATFLNGNYIVPVYGKV
ncbi:saccharopine dehydrogenase [Flavobacterium cauense R2A-7]|uniref:Saccharopine dehydrogenase-like NADP-dependent oxidoreductase n=1 Tax=Flavobacterium cauense R2A-7 TaxID=1341154 RepID=V6S3U8_9FLAO|nr:saccharopine dehydrogenase C-terminal domain-containing protein [Flavobacterium cauense]ESU19055.1 saccharopine dehydrogenase [Flavobacterium cauense R2A-7]KGO82318.1 saccharopine dehydrogenase [Flavobacterium cauense R2A-7]TWI15282.1 saccharopine dehydrogenase-like NADP-dependent oxidoreductase [Flavobacterium cauense R2A-7]